MERRIFLKSSLAAGISISLPRVAFLYDSASAQEAKPSAHEGEEFIYVFSGEVEIVYGAETYRLSVGDSIYYDSIVAHNVHCRGDRPAQILAVVYAPF